MTPRPYAEIGGELRLLVRLTPKAGRDAVLGLKATVSGGVEVSMSVTAVPEKGKANAALLKLLARQLGVAAGRLRIAAGETDRHKQVALSGSPDEARPLLDRWLASIEMKEAKA